MKTPKVTQPTQTERLERLELAVQLLESKVALLVSRMNKRDTGESLWRD